MLHVSSCYREFPIISNYPVQGYYMRMLPRQTLTDTHLLLVAISQGRWFSIKKKSYIKFKIASIGTVFQYLTNYPFQFWKFSLIVNREPLPKNDSNTLQIPHWQTLTKHASSTTCPYSRYMRIFSDSYRWIVF